MSEPLLISLDVACPVEHAFSVWTSRIDTWWPRDHTVSGEPGTAVVVQGGVGGRIYERTATGVEHDWGEVLVWEPPTRFGYAWHLGRDAADATEVQIRFAAQGESSTRIEIEHRGWEQFGAAADERRSGNQAGWDAMLPHYLDALTTLTD